MKYNQPFGVSDPAAPYVNGDPSVGLMGSIPPAAAIEYPQRELVALIADAGLVPTNSDLAQVPKAIQCGALWNGVDVGTVNSLQVTLSPRPDQYFDGMFLWVLVGIGNTGPATINVNALGAKNIVRRGGAVLQAGDMPAGFRSLLVYNGPHANFELYGIGFGAGGGPPILSGNSNLYVNGSTGDDTIYDGTSATISAPHGPFKTIGRAITETFKYGPSVYTMTINVAAGTYAEAVATPTIPGPGVTILGAGINSTFVTGANNASTFNAAGPNLLKVQNLDATTGTGTGPPCCFEATGSGTISTSGCSSSGAVAGAIWVAYAGGHVSAGSHTFKSGLTGSYIFWAVHNGFLGLAQNAVYTFAGTTNITYDAVASAGGSIEVPTPPFLPTWQNTGFYTGQRYNAYLNGVVNSQGAGASWFPGTIAGNTASGGQYG